MPTTTGNYSDDDEGLSDASGAAAAVEEWEEAAHVDMVCTTLWEVLQDNIDLLEAAPQAGTVPAQLAKAEKTLESLIYVREQVDNLVLDDLRVFYEDMFRSDEWGPWREDIRACVLQPKYAALSRVPKDKLNIYTEPKYQAALAALRAIGLEPKDKSTTSFHVLFHEFKSNGLYEGLKGLIEVVYTRFETRNVSTGSYPYTKEGSEADHRYRSYTWLARWLKEFFPSWVSDMYLIGHAFRRMNDAHQSTEDAKVKKQEEVSARGEPGSSKITGLKGRSGRQKKHARTNISGLPPYPSVSSSAPLRIVAAAAARTVSRDHFIV